MTVKRAQDNMVFKLSIMYSVTNQLPELFFTCEKEEVDEDGDRTSVIVTDIDEIVLAAGFKKKTLDEKVFVVTQKEHPVDNMIVWSIHECKIKELMPAFTESKGKAIDKTNILL